MKKTIKFPEGFYWGASIAAYQCEGNNINDWTEWEKENCNKLAQEAESKYAHWVSNWEEAKKELTNPKNYISGKAVDHYNRFEEDFDIAKSLNLNAFRFSIEWSRIEPEEGKFNEKEIEHYNKVINELKKRNIEPFVTLWHYTLPLWVKRKGGFNSKEVANYYFPRYVKKISSALKDDVQYWLTMNEPEIYVAATYLNQSWPSPAKNNIKNYYCAYNNLINTHKKSYLAIKETNPNAKIGIATQNMYFKAYKNKFINKILTKTCNWWWNFYFLNKINKYQDFIGLNHYTYVIIDYREEDKNFAPHNLWKYSVLFKPCHNRQSDWGWSLHPDSMYHVLKDLKKYNKPIYITENGLPDADDANRAWFITNTLNNVHRAIEEGLDVRGYFHWSLMDNFEWEKGFWPKFGLLEIDYNNNLKRKIRKSAYEYSKIIKENGLIIDED